MWRQITEDGVISVWHGTHSPIYFKTAEGKLLLEISRQNIEMLERRRTKRCRGYTNSGKTHTKSRRRYIHLIIFFWNAAVASAYFIWLAEIKVSDHPVESNGFPKYLFHDFYLAQITFMINWLISFYIDLLLKIKSRTSKHLPISC